MNKAVLKPLALLLLMGVMAAAAARTVYQQPAQFISDVFGGDPPDPQVLWITKDLRGGVRDIMGHGLGVLRVRFWGRDHRTAWILEETGKEQPITVGIVVQDGRIARLKVLIYRESRGAEVRHPFFTEQFTGAGLEDHRLDRRIDGISGATLSVRALTKLARLALYLHQHTEFADEPSS